MRRSAAIVGAGIQGLLVARELQAHGWTVSVYEQLPRAALQGATSSAAGGMLAPYSELEHAESLVCQLGLEALALWPAILPPGVFFRQEGSLLLSHIRDQPYYQVLTQRIIQQAPLGSWRWVSVAELEPELGSQFERGLYLPQEAHLDNRQLIPALIDQLASRGVIFHFEQSIASPNAGKVDRVIDCRGIHAQTEQPELRGIRGEAVLLEAPQVKIRRPVRLMHPRYAVYIVPRDQNRYYLGATSIEGAGAGPVTLRSALELLSAAFAVHSGFAEAKILGLLQGLRPAYPDHLPRIRVCSQSIAVNGLYRHGFLLAPILAQRLRLFLEDRPVPQAEQLFHFA